MLVWSLRYVSDNALDLRFQAVVRSKTSFSYSQRALGEYCFLYYFTHAYSISSLLYLFYLDVKYFLMTSHNPDSKRPIYGFLWAKKK